MKPECYGLKCEMFPIDSRFEHLIPAEGVLGMGSNWEKWILEGKQEFAEFAHLLSFLSRDTCHHVFSAITGG